ncbi:MAG: hypothetical protein PHS44_04895 [Candidatus Dojkabacteria bacterium]|jgi:hypothetical protein|nr:hypothetical protein [Candidatus Dojkabacteria bacterium]
MNYLEKLDSIINFVLKNLKVSAEEKEKLANKIKLSYYYRIFKEFERLSGKELNKTSLGDAEQISKYLQEINESLGEETFLQVMTEQAEVIVEELSELVKDNAQNDLKQKYLEFVTSTLTK